MKTMKLVRIVLAVNLLTVVGMSMFGCKKADDAGAPVITSEQDAINTDKKLNVGTDTGSVSGQNQGQAVAGSNKYAKTYDGQVTGRTRIENGQILEWAENYPEDKTIKPTNIEYVGNEGNHRVYYNVDGKEIKVSVAGDTGTRYFYEAGNEVNFADVSKTCEKSNEAVLNSVAANRKLNEVIDSKYR